MGMVRHDELTRLFRNLEWNLSEFGEADFVWKGRNSYSCNRLFLIREGEGSLRNHTADESFRMRAGFGYFMPPRLDLSFDFPPGLRFFSFHFQLEMLPGVDLFAGNPHCREFRLEHDELEQAARFTSEPPDWKVFFALEVFMYRNLLELAGEVTLDWDWRKRLRERYGGLLEFLRVRATARTTVEELATAAGRPYDRLSREFRRDFGCTLKEFLARELCRRAENRLRRSSLSVKEIAAELEFGNEFYFSRFFRRQTGVAPRDYRKMT